MSMQGDAGAETASRSILALVRAKMEENKDNEEVKNVLEEIADKAKSIIAAARSSWGY